MTDFKTYRKVAKPGEKNLSYLVDGIYRHFSIFLSYAFVRLGFSADGITILSIFIGILSAVFLLFMHPISFLSAAVMLHFYHLLDCADGEMARYRRYIDKRQSKTIAGGYIDFLGFVLVPPFIVFALGLSLIHYIEGYTLLIVFISFTAAICIAGPAKIAYSRVALDSVIEHADSFKNTPFGNLLMSRSGLPGYNLPSNFFVKAIFLFSNAFLPALNLHLTILAIVYIVDWLTAFSFAPVFHLIYVGLLYVAYILHTVWAIIKNFRMLKNHPLE